MTDPTNDLSNPIRYAGFTSRLKAFAFDYLIISGYILLLAGAAAAVTWLSGRLGFPLQWPENPILADLAAFLTLVLPVMLYFSLGESSARQATWGKRKAGLRVVDAGGGRLTPRRAFTRSLLKFLPWQMAHTCLFHIPGWPLQAVTALPAAVIAGFAATYGLAAVYTAVVFISKKRRTPYDWAAGAYVIKE